ncbi:DNA repair protein RecO [Legionella impletisoli]|uniref:DNA repair protein RecO n=1 Tax=Legionella impletisoli TaxID=343510 RepID=A0A917JZG0_9GAMM|nr:DNA repair protein RecO [Legionella impletisoli]GGI91745.1 DNA repair protein RecO [Legionella impletisoli]
MTIDAFEAWVLHKRWSGDTSAQVIFLTKEQGVFTGLYKGARSKSKQALLQPFTPVWLAINRRGNRHYVQQLEMRAPSLCFTGNALFSALYLNELVSYILQPNDTHPMVYDAYESALYSLTEVVYREDLEVVLRQFEQRLLKQCGYQIILTHDVNAHSIVADKQYQFIPGEGFQMASNGFWGEHLLAFAENRLEHPETRKTAKRIMRQAIDYALEGRTLKSRALFR